MESFLTTISRLIENKKLPTLMIGGHALTALGHPRATFDLTLVDERAFETLWKTKTGFKPITTPRVVAMIALKLHAISQPAGEGPKPHQARFLDPRMVEKHFAPLMINPPSPEERWARKVGAVTFPCI